MSEKLNEDVQNEIFFIEHYCLSNGKHIILKDYQVNFLKWLKNIKKTYKYEKETNKGK